MKDEIKFKLAVFIVSALCVLSIVYNVASEYVLPDIEGFFKRKLYYERVISQKGLSLHKADYWRQEGPE
jgi:hypothetical protein